MFYYYDSKKKKVKQKQLKSSKSKGCHFRLPIQTSSKGDLSVKPLIEESDVAHTKKLNRQVEECICSLECSLIYLICLNVLNYLYGIGIYLNNSQLCARNGNPSGYRVLFSCKKTLLLLHIITERLTDLSLISITNFIEAVSSKLTLICHWVKYRSCVCATDEQANFSTPEESVMRSNVLS